MLCWNAELSNWHHCPPACVYKPCVLQRIEMPTTPLIPQQLELRFSASPVLQYEQSRTSPVTCAFQRKTCSYFAGTQNPRHLRALRALLRRPLLREELDLVTGASNSPDLVAQLRRRGLSIPCRRVLVIDIDGKTCRPGLYRLSRSDRWAVQRWLRTTTSSRLSKVAAAGPCRQR